MKKLLFVGLFALVSLSGATQPLKELYPQNAYLVFKKGLSDKVDTYYSIPNLKIFVNDAGVGERIEISSKLELVGFAWTQKISNNVYVFLEQKQVVQAPVVVTPTPDNRIVRSTQLKIPGYENVSDIYLSDASLKTKDANRLNVQLATHSISLGENTGDKRSIVNYTITDQNGKVWVEVIQKEATTEGRLGGRYGNNHPDNQYLSGLAEDCNIYLPLGNIYTITIENRGEMTVDFWVHHPWSENGQERLLHREDMPSEGVQFRYYTIDTVALELAQLPDYKRTIKININGKL